jgi:hypothetical protein
MRAAGWEPTNRTLRQGGLRTRPYPDPTIRHSLFAIRYLRFLTDPCSPTEIGVQQRMRGCPRTEARFPYRQVGVHKPARAQRPAPLRIRAGCDVGGSGTRPYLDQHHPQFAIRYSRFAVRRC